MHDLIRSLDAQISLMVASATKISKTEVRNRLFSNDEGSLVVAPAARVYWGDLRKVKLSPEFAELDAPDQVLVNAWLRAFNFSDGQFTVGYTLKSNEEWTYIERWTCKQCGTFEIEFAFDDLDDPECPACGGEMEYVPAIEEYATRADDMDSMLPYTTVEENEQFYDAQRGGYGYDDYGQDPDRWDDTDSRDPNEEGAWAEYLEPKGMREVYASTEWRALRKAYQTWIAQADALIKRKGIQPREKWGYVASHVRPYLEEVWDKAVGLYLNGDINTVAMALVVHKMVSATKFSREEMVEMTKIVPAKSHVDGTPLGISLFRWMQDYREELDDILEDGEDLDLAPRFYNEEQRVADEWAAYFERELTEHWKWQAKLRKPVLVENGVKIWASQFTGIGDVAFNLAYLHAMAAELPKPEAEKAAYDAKRAARWSPNDAWVVDASASGLVLNNRSTMPWIAAAQVKLAVPMFQKERVLNTLRSLWVKTDPKYDTRDLIALVGQHIKAL
jgi:hypothetical protein